MVKRKWSGGFSVHGKGVPDWVEVNKKWWPALNAKLKYAIDHPDFVEANRDEEVGTTRMVLSKILAAPTVSDAANHTQACIKGRETITPYLFL